MNACNCLRGSLTIHSKALYPQFLMYYMPKINDLSEERCPSVFNVFHCCSLCSVLLLRTFTQWRQRTKQVLCVKRAVRHHESKLLCKALQQWGDYHTHCQKYKVKSTFTEKENGFFDTCSKTSLFLALFYHSLTFMFTSFDFERYLVFLFATAPPPCPPGLAHLSD